MARRAAQKVEDGHTDDPARPDNILSQDGDNEGSVIDIDLSVKTVDVNADGKDDDARSDAEKAEEARAARDSQREEEQDERRGRARGEDEDDEQYSKRVKRRIAREQALRRRSDEAVSNVTAENQRLKERLAKLERGGGTVEQHEKSAKELQAKLDELKKKLGEAIEAGDTAKQLELQIELGDVQTELRLVKRDIERAKTAPPEDTATATATPTKRPQIVEDWLSANRKWWNLPSARELKAASVELDKQINAEIEAGDLEFETYSPEHVDELTRRLAEEAGRLKLDFEIKDFNGEAWTGEADEDAEDEKTATAAAGRTRGTDVKTNDKGRRAPQGGMGGREGRRGPQTDVELAKTGKARLTTDDYAQMRVFKLDPNNADHVKRFAKERVRTILNEARNGGRR